MRNPTILATVALALTLTACSGDSDDEPDTFRAAGGIALIDLDVTGNGKGGNCAGTGGYDDLRKGAQVRVMNSSGDVVALGEIYAAESLRKTACMFSFSVEDVPSGQGPYSVEVAHRGEVGFSEDEAANLELSIGEFA